MSGRELELAKPPGGIPGKPPSKAKAGIADELKGRLPLALLLEALELPPSSYHYAGEVTPAADNLVGGNFHADAPNELRLTGALRAENVSAVTSRR